MEDPNSCVDGRGLAHLRRAGLEVQIGVLEKEARFLNRAFIKAKTRGLPYVIWKTAQTLDGKIASHTGKSRWITGPKSRAIVHGLRAQSDAILTGGHTIRQDDPSLTAHGRGGDPLRLVLSRSLRLAGFSQVFQGDRPAWIITDSKKKSADILLKYSIKNGFKNIMEVFKYLCKIGINQLLLECGGNGSMDIVKAGLVDEVYAFVAPRFLGGQDAPTALEGLGWPSPARGPRLKRVTVEPVGKDILIHGFM
jgi:diaminohydroxyphosphoribosylaminopyrimidine deaminase/5-amino-6-(5-phosphoribosylamino)uracil reductase